jgi:hypothetical protein
MHAGDQSHPAVLLLGLLVFATCIPTQVMADLFNFVRRCPIPDSKGDPVSFASRAAMHAKTTMTEDLYPGAVEPQKKR